MPQITVSAQSIINAPANLVYQALATPKIHEKFLPEPFYDIEVDSNNILNYKIDFAKGAIEIGMETSQPEPGRVLVHTDMKESGLITTFTLTPQDKQTLLEIRSVWKGQDGLIGALEKVISPIRMRSVYKKELKQINQYLADTNK